MHSSQRTVSLGSGCSVQSSPVKLLNHLCNRIADLAKTAPTPESTTGQLKGWTQDLLKLAVRFDCLVFVITC
jgi:hypothetical protein